MAAEEEEEDQVPPSENGENVPPQLEPPPAISEKAQFAPPSDSGLGTDMPTAALSATESDYFKGAE